MQNLREAIAGYRGRLMHEGNDVKRNALLQVCAGLSFVFIHQHKLLNSMLCSMDETQHAIKCTRLCSHCSAALFATGFGSHYYIVFVRHALPPCVYRCA